jgi:hypothetical protein
VAALGLAVAGTNAQTGSLTDLGTLLSGQKNLTTFYGLIQVRGVTVRKCSAMESDRTRSATLVH